ncbi:MAG: cytochrome c biogenesis protein CcdA [Candidatus Curtissbacteria bacterium]|nr:cytochrome c biogenesis protein CcdA [Candidatus Curtissbacteria bacterium]
MEGAILQTSLVAAFAAGIVALFAPCCITYLLPAYLGSVFKEKEKVLLMTLVFGLGIFIVMMPAILGVALLSKALFIYHGPIYFVGGLVMIAIALITILGLRLPMPHLPGRAQGKTDILSIFTLGIFSGITSACCAPVLIGILALTFLSPNFLGALGIGAVYVLGMITPLLIISLFLSGKIERFMFLRKPVRQLSFLGKDRTLLMSNFIASTIFFITGVAIIILNTTGRLGKEDVNGFTKLITGAGNYVNQLVGGNIAINIIFLMVIIFGLYKLIKKI